MCFCFRPKSGSMLLYSRKKVRYRRDGYCWKKRKDGKTTREDHMKLKVQGTEVFQILFFAQLATYKSMLNLYNIINSGCLLFGFYEKINKKKNYKTSLKKQQKLISMCKIFKSLLIILSIFINKTSPRFSTLSLGCSRF